MQKSEYFGLPMTYLNIFIFILIYTGYHSLPRSRIFWEKEVDAGIPLIYEEMSGAKFEMIKRYINFGDNNYLNTANKFANVGILYDVANKILHQFWFSYSFYSIGKNSSKQINRTKSIRFVYKIFVICSDDVYPYSNDLYCGKKYTAVKDSKNLATRSVLDCVTEIINWSDKEIFFFFFTN